MNRRNFLAVGAGLIVGEPVRRAYSFLGPEFDLNRVAFNQAMLDNYRAYAFDGILDKDILIAPLARTGLVDFLEAPITFRIQTEAPKTRLDKDLIITEAPTSEPFYCEYGPHALKGWFEQLAEGLEQ